MYGARKYKAEQKKQDTKDHIQDDSIYIKSKNEQDWVLVEGRIDRR